MQAEDDWLLYRWRNSGPGRPGADAPLMAMSMREARRIASRPPVNGHAFIVSDADDGRPVGEAELHDVDKRNASAGIWVMIDERFRGQGYGTDALAQLVDYAFLRLNLHKVEARVPEESPDSIEFAMGRGFELDGTVRDDHFAGGRYRSSALMSRIREERA